MVDLHLFLGRPLKEAQKDSQAQDDGLLGSVPQLIVDAEQNFLKTAHGKSHDLVSLFIIIIKMDTYKPLTFCDMQGWPRIPDVSREKFELYDDYFTQT